MKRTQKVKQKKQSNKKPEIFSGFEKLTPRKKAKKLRKDYRSYAKSKAGKFFLEEIKKIRKKLRMYKTISISLTILIVIETVFIIYGYYIK